MNGAINLSELNVKMSYFASHTTPSVLMDGNSSLLKSILAVLSSSGIYFTIGVDSKTYFFRAYLLLPITLIVPY